MVRLLVHLAELLKRLETILLSASAALFGYSTIAPEADDMPIDQLYSIVSKGHMIAAIVAAVLLSIVFCSVAWRRRSSVIMLYKQIIREFERVLKNR